MITFLHPVITSRSSYSWIFHMLVITAEAPSNLSTRGSVARAPVCSAGATLGPVARSLVSANRWLTGIKMYRFPWYLTLVSTNHASSNPGLVTSISREVARERQVKGKARARARALTTPLTALPLASTISRGSHRWSWKGDLARRVLFSELTSELTVSRDLKIRRRRRQRGRQKSNRFNNQNNNFARASLFFVHFFAVAARLRRENA